MPPGGKAKYKSRFLQNIWHLNFAMYTTNNALVPDPDDDDVLTSTPRQWPILEVGLRMCNWADDMVKFYLLGNPVVWWSGTASLILFNSMLFWYLVRKQRQYIEFSPGKNEFYLHIY